MINHLKEEADQIRQETKVLYRSMQKQYKEMMQEFKKLNICHEEQRFAILLFNFCDSLISFILNFTELNYSVKWISIGMTPFKHVLVKKKSRKFKKK